jgi:hypothetical protein
LQQWVDTQVNVNRGLTDDPEITMLVARANEDFDSLTSAELLRLQHVLYNHFAQWMVAFTNQRMDLLDSDEWGMVARGYELFVQSLPAAGRMWELCGFVFDEAFRNYVDSVVSRAESSEPNS